MGDQIPNPNAIFELSAGPYAGGELHVLSFDGNEEMNGLYAFDIVVWGKDLDERLAESAVLGLPAVLKMYLPDGKARRVRGLVATIATMGLHQGGRRAYRITVVPRLWLLGRRLNSRIFQDKTVQQIVDVILDEYEIARDWNLHSRYPARQYCVQYQETDECFVRRLLAEEGIFFHFDHLAGEEPENVFERIVFGDSAGFYSEIDGDSGLVFRPEGSDGGALQRADNHVSDLQVATHVASSAVVMRDYDFKRPLLDLTSGSGGVGEGARRLEVYDHHGEYQETDVDANNASVYLEQLRASTRTASGASGCRRLVPGRCFHMSDHDIESLNARWVVTLVKHRGVSPEAGRDGTPVYENSFCCVPAEVPFRPSRPARIVRQVQESAVVVGPAGQEIFTDTYGRIRVQFHWDRDGHHDDHSSCWIRVVQAWAGTGWGFQFVPRIGMEVLVTFIGGDQDRPIVSGCVYNALNPPPFTLPSDKTRSGVRTRSTPRSAGFNEVSFEDAVDGEQIFLHAQRDLDEVVRNNHSSAITHDRTIAIGGDRKEDIAGNKRERVAQSRVEQVGENQREDIGKNRQINVHGDDQDTVRGSRVTSVDGDYGVQVGGGFSTMIGDSKKPRSGNLFAWGDFALGTGQKIILTAKDGISLHCGESAIDITKDGITIKAGTISIDAAKVVNLTGNGPALSLGEDAEIVSKKVRIISSKASVVLDDDAHVDGKNVLLNCKGIEPDAINEDGSLFETKHLSLKLTDPEFAPYANKAYMLTAGGINFEGSTDGDGKISVDIPKDADLAQIIVFVADRPEGEKRRYLVTLGELPDAHSVRGAQLRLRNLGYFWGTPGDEIDTPTKHALEEFQADHGLEPTGNLDGATAGKLGEIHGH